MSGFEEETFWSVNLCFAAYQSCSCGQVTDLSVPLVVLAYSEGSECHCVQDILSPMFHVCVNWLSDCMKDGLQVGPKNVKEKGF